MRVAVSALLRTSALGILSCHLNFQDFSEASEIEGIKFPFLALLDGQVSEP